MNNNRQKIQDIRCWVEYTDDYNIKHLVLIKDKFYLKYLQNNYDAIIIENIEA